MNTPNFVNVALPIPMRQLFSYQLPEGMQVNDGARVLVPFGNRQLVGVVISQASESTFDVSKVKVIISVIDKHPEINAKHLKFIQQCASYYHHPIGDVISHALPTVLRQNQPVPKQAITVWQLTPLAKAKGLAELLTSISKSAVKQSQLLTFIAKQDTLSWPEIRTAGYSKSQLSALTDKKFIEALETFPEKFTWQASLLNSSEKPTLSDGQSLCINAIHAQMNQFYCHLIFGVTGSGKTEIYLQVMERVLAQNKQVLLLVPEIGLTPQTLMRFEQRFKVPIFLHHSGLNDTERLTTWQAAKSGVAAIIIGTRSAIFNQFDSLGLIVVDEEHDASFKQQDGFRYQGRDVAILRAKQENIPILLGSATPSLESLHNALTGKYQLHQLMSRPGLATEAKLSVVDMKQELHDFGLSKTVQATIKKHLARNEQVLMFLNRRGYSPAINCKECHWVAECTRCNRTYTLHKDQQLLICHHCNSQKRLPKQCPSCGSIRLVPLGQGTEQLEEKIAELFEGFSTVRIDRDSTRRKNALATMLKQIANNEHQLLIGTQMLAKGHHFPNVTLVVIVNMDSALFSFDFRATEQMAQLLVQVAGRAGRAEKPGKVLIQSEFPDHPLMQQLIHFGYANFAKHALQERQQALLPPYNFLALVRAEAPNDNAPNKFLRELSKLNLPECKVAGPMPAPIEKRAGKYRFHLLITSANRAALHQACSILINEIANNPWQNKVKYSIDIDPLDLTW